MSRSSPLESKDLGQSWRPLGMHRTHDPHEGIVWQRGEGCYLWDGDGARYLDCISGYSANNLGHAHPELVRALQEQAMRGTHFPGGESEVRRTLERELANRTAEDVRHRLGVEVSPDLGVWLSTTGARAIEVAWKIAHAFRPGGMVRFDLGYHGRSLATSLLSDTPRSGVVASAGEHPPLASSGSLPFPRCEPGESIDTACERSLDFFRKLLERDADRFSALLLEPAIGARGYFFAPESFYQQLVNMARQAGMLIVSDEIQMGLGRLGRWSGAIRAGWLPDLWVFGKSLGGGMVPISAVVGAKSILDRLGPNLESETFAGQPLSCAIALKVVSLLSENGIVERSCQLHEELRSHFARIMPLESVVGSGSASALNFKALVSRSDAAAQARRFVLEAREQGVLLHLTGPERDRVAIIPPLTVEEREMNTIRNAVCTAWKKTLLEKRN